MRYQQAHHSRAPLGCRTSHEVPPCPPPRAAAARHFPAINPAPGDQSRPDLPPASWLLMLGASPGPNSTYFWPGFFAFGIYLHRGTLSEHKTRHSPLRLGCGGYVLAMAPGPHPGLGIPSGYFRCRFCGVGALLLCDSESDF